MPVAINTGLSGLPYWGSDTGGFVPTKELTGELYVRWFQFSAFCPLFSSHGRTWKLRLPWQWNTGEMGPDEASGKDAANPDESEFHNGAVEPICRKYVDLRYRLMPYVYSHVWETHLTGLPLMRALWLHYPSDPQAVSCGDQYLWGRDMLVAPVLEKGATERKLYLPQGRWYDFWTGSPCDGGREITREVNLETIPVSIRAGALVPFGPVKQYTCERTDEPLQIHVYPGADGRFVVYEDDRVTFNLRRGEYRTVRFEWSDSSRELTVTPEHGVAADREFILRILPDPQLR